MIFGLPESQKLIHDEREASGPIPLEELKFRFNDRTNPYIVRDTLARIMRTEPLEYRKLVGASVQRERQRGGLAAPRRTD